MIKNNGNGKSRSLTPAKSREPAWQHFIPTSNWTAMGKEEHFVQFYESDQFLLDSLSGFIREGIQVGDACVVVPKAVYIAGITLQQLGKHIMAVLIGGPYRVKFLLYAE